MSTEVLKEILAYIDEHIYEKISLLELAVIAENQLIHIKFHLMQLKCKYLIL